MIKRILIVGLGSIGRRHLRLARELLPAAEIAVLRHKVELIVPDGADYVFSTMDEALLFAPTLAVIANPATFHLSVALPLAEAGVHLLIEKPLSTTSEGVEDLLKVCKKKNVVLAIGYNLRYLQSLQKFKSMLDNRMIGELWSVRSEIGQYLPLWRPDTDYRESVSARDALGGGVLLELSHEIDYLCWIFGDVEFVYAALAQQSDLAIDVEDSAHLILEFVANGSEKPLVASLSLDFIRQDRVRLCTVIGRLGSLRWDGITGTIELYTSDTKAWRNVYSHQTASDESYVGEWQNFISSINDCALPAITGMDGLKVLKVIEAARISTKAKKRVTIGSDHELRES